MLFKQVMLNVRLAFSATYALVGAKTPMKSRKNEKWRHTTVTGVWGTDLEILLKELYTRSILLKRGRMDNFPTVRLIQPIAG